jgi:hypothetical protein
MDMESLMTAAQERYKNEGMAMLIVPREDMRKQFLKAQDWLNEKSANWHLPIVAVRSWGPEFSGYIFRMKRENKPSVWYLMELDGGLITRIKRICVEKRD